MILNCRDGKVKSSGGRVFEDERVQEEKEGGSHKQQRSDSQAAVMLGAHRAAEGVSISVGEVTEDSSNLWRTFLEGEDTLVSPISKHKSRHNQQQQQ